MSATRGTLQEDLNGAREESPTHFWGAIVAAGVSLFFPIVGVIAAYSGYQLTSLMDRKWVGIVFASLGLASLTLWFLYLLGFVQP